MEAQSRSFGKLLLRNFDSEALEEVQASNAVRNVPRARVCSLPTEPRVTRDLEKLFSILASPEERPTLTLLGEHLAYF